MMRPADLLTAGPSRSAIATDLRSWLPLLAGALTPPDGPGLIPAPGSSPTGTGRVSSDSAGVDEQSAGLDKLPVLLLGGLASTPQSLEPMYRWLLQAGARPSVCHTAYGVDCGERTILRVTAEATRLVDSAGRRCAVVAHSRGGQFGRVVAVRRPDLVCGLVTLSTPVNRIFGVCPRLRAGLVVLGSLGSLGVPGVVRWGCLLGDCCRRMRDDLLAPMPSVVPYLSVYTRQDRVVDWRSCLDPFARHHQVVASHSGVLRSTEVQDVLRAELGQLSAATPDAAEDPPALTAAA